MKGAIERALGIAKIEQFLQGLQSRRIRIRDFDEVLAKGVLDQGGEALAGDRRTVSGLYHALSVSDQAQMREFYLSRIEDADSTLRTRFQKLYRYY